MFWWVRISSNLNFFVPLLFVIVFIANVTYFSKVKYGINYVFLCFLYPLYVLTFKDESLTNDTYFSKVTFVP